MSRTTIYPDGLTVPGLRIAGTQSRVMNDEMTRRGIKFADIHHEALDSGLSAYQIPGFADAARRQQLSITDAVRCALRSWTAAHSDADSPAPVEDVDRILLEQGSKRLHELIGTLGEQFEALKIYLSEAKP